MNPLQTSLVRTFLPPVILSWIWIACAGCGIIESTEHAPSGEEEQGERKPGRFDRYLKVDQFRPRTDEIAAKPTFVIRFNDYIDDDAVRSYETGTLSSGAISRGGWAEYVMTDKKLVWTARSSMPTGLEASFALTDSFKSITGSPLKAQAPLGTFQVTDRKPSLPGPSTESPTWSDVEAIFERRCAECHADPDWELNPLTRESMVGVLSDQVDRYLIRLYDPADSYLMQKLLWDYPDRRLEPQPPAWAGGEQLPREELLTIERWIGAGAPK